MTEVNWGPTGEMVYKRTYSRIKPDGSNETWPETVQRVVDGNLALVDARYQLPNEREDLIRMMTEFKLLPAGRHLWASGVPNAQHLFNCWVSGWGDKPSDHFHFTFMRLMEGGGVGANYSQYNLQNYPDIEHFLKVEIVCDPEHPDYEELLEAGVISGSYDPEWTGAFQIEDSREGWAEALVDLIDTHYRKEVVHFNRVYDVSRVRPAGSKLKTFGGRASGPLPLARMLIEVCEILTTGYAWPLTGMDAMRIDHAIAQCVVAGGVRRSARMAMMHWADPEIFEFIDCKKDGAGHWTTNISVEVDEEFWSLASKGYGHKDVDRADMPRHKHALEVLKAIGEGAVRNGEPGMWDSSLSNVGEPNRVICTNPCGEITLEAWEPCNLGHINLAAFVDSSGRLEWTDLFKAHELMTRFLIRATFTQVSDPKSREVLDRNRRIGVGHLGVASFLALRKIKYSDAPTDYEFRYLLRQLAAEVDKAAEKFAHELRIPVPVKKRTVAPTGSIAKLPGVSEGIHPIFSRYFIRRVRLSMLDPAQVQMLADYADQGYHIENDLMAANTGIVSIATKDTLVQAVEELYGAEVAEDIIQSQDELTLTELLGFQALYQTLWADNAVSFTANVAPDRYTGRDIETELVRFSGLIKGSTIFPEGSFEQAPLERITKEEYDAAFAKAVADGVDEECANGACPIR